jgi:hypothetical protein
MDNLQNCDCYTKCLYTECLMLHYASLGVVLGSANIRASIHKFVKSGHIQKLTSGAD